MKRSIATALAYASRIRRMGPLEVSQHILRRVYQRLDAGSPGFPYRTDGDVADSGRLNLMAPAPRPPRDRPLRVGWLTMPPGLGSGGHTTMFRMVAGLEEQGHECVIVLYDPSGGDVAQRRDVIRRGWPWVNAEVRGMNEGFADLDGCVATSWESAHVLAARSGTVPLRRLYFVQDFEPFFYAHGGMYALAEDTYRFGFRTIALGEMVASRLRSEIGIEPDVVPFGCATDDYYLKHGGQSRSGVVFYAKADVPRRGYDVARLALIEFHRRHPEHEIHLYGDRAPELPIPTTRHGKLTVVELNDLYNRCVAGFAMSFTNISLVAEELLAAGVVPVVNDSADARADLDNPYVRWAPPRPGSLAEALCDAVEAQDTDAVSRAAAASVSGRSWAETQRRVVTIIEHEVYGSAR